MKPANGGLSRDIKVNISRDWLAGWLARQDSNSRIPSSKPLLKLGPFGLAACNRTAKVLVRENRGFYANIYLTVGKYVRPENAYEKKSPKNAALLRPIRP